MMRAYIDTNILVDLMLARQEFLPDAQRVFEIKVRRHFLSPHFFLLLLQKISAQ